MATGKRDISRHYRVKRRTVELPEKECKHRGVCMEYYRHTGVCIAIPPWTNPIVVAPSNINNWPCPSPSFRPSLESSDIFMDRGRARNLSFLELDTYVYILYMYKICVFHVAKPRDWILWDFTCRILEKKISRKDCSNFILNITIAIFTPLSIHVIIFRHT